MASQLALPTTSANHRLSFSFTPSSTLKHLRVCHHLTGFEAVSWLPTTNTSLRLQASPSDAYSGSFESSDKTWDDLGFEPVPTDYMYIMKSSGNGEFVEGGLQHFGNIQLNPSACVLNYGQGIIEGLKAYRKQGNSIVLFRPEENGLLMRMGAERMCMPAPTVDQFVEAVKMTVLANKRWVPPPDKGLLYIRPLLLGSGPVLSVMPAPEFMFLVYVTPVANFLKEGFKPIHVAVQSEIHHAVPGGSGSVKAIGNYGAILKAQIEAKAEGYFDFLYLDSAHKQYLKQASTTNIFVVKGKIISTPLLEGTIIPGVTRKSVIEIARSQGFQVEERRVSVEELFDADEVFLTGTFICLLPVSSITIKDKRVSYAGTGFGRVSQRLYRDLSNLQMGITEDTMGWTVTLKLEKER